MGVALSVDYVAGGYDDLTGVTSVSVSCGECAMSA